VTIEVLEPGAFTTIQDPHGRPGWRHLGVPYGGAADPWAACLANRLVGNPDDSPLLEATWHGPTLRFVAPSAVALAGELEAAIDSLPFATGVAREIRAGSLLRIRSGRDARGYLAVAGGLRVDRVLGSAATDVRGGFGGLDGRPLRSGDRLEVGTAGGDRQRWLGRWPSGPIRIVPGPHADALDPAALVSGRWRVGADADRTGARLDGPALSVQGRTEIPSVGLPLGAIQVPPDGRPIVMLADRPVTGGYPVPAVVIGADVGRVARLRPGDPIAFASVSLEVARDALRRMRDELAALEPLDAPDDEELGWAGSLR
jgi:biotin-dependent carboxylase-like uncharacterized protein